MDGKIYNCIAIIDVVLETVPKIKYALNFYR